MKFSKFLPFLFLLSCSPHLQTINLKQPYSAKGFAYIYNDYDFNNKIIKGRMNNEKLQISHQNLKTGTLLKISNPKNKESIVLKNIKRIKYPEFYKVLITEPVAEKLNIDKNLPILEIFEIRKNKSFVAEEAKIYSEKALSLNKSSYEALFNLGQIALFTKNNQLALKFFKESLGHCDSSHEIYRYLGIAQYLCS